MRVSGPACLLLGLLCSCGLGAALTGKVLDASGAAVAGATVWLYRSSPEGDVAGLALRATTTTGADGGFTVADPAPEPPGAAGTWRVFVAGEGFAVSQTVTEETATALQVRLAVAEALAGTIQTPEGKPLAAATVTPSCVYDAAARFSGGVVSLPAEVAARFAAVTDEAGRWRVAVRARGWTVVLRVAAEGCGELHVAAAGVEAGPTLPAITLTRAGRLRGKVTCPQQPEAAAGRKLSLNLQPVPSPAHAPSVFAAVGAVTDAQGGFTLAALPPGRWRVCPSERQGLPYQFRPTTVEVLSGREALLELKTELATAVRGRVLAADSGRGLAGAAVACYATDGSYQVRTTTRDDGGFELLALPGTLSLQVSGTEGYLGTSPFSGRQFTVSAEGLTVPDVRLKPARSLQVEVVEEGGRPVAEAEVYLKQVTAEPSWFPDHEPRARTDAGGRCLLRNLQEAPGSVHARRGDLACEPVTVQIGVQAGSVRLVLKPGRAVSALVRVLDQGGKPLADARAVLYESTESTRRHLRCGAPDAEGRITHSGLEPGLKYQFQVEAPGCYAVESAVWEATADGPHDFGVLALTRHRGWLAGTVVDAAGRPLPGVRVFNLCDAPTVAACTTDAGGRFRLEGLVEGCAYAFADSPQHRFAAARAACGTAELKIALHPRMPLKLGAPAAPAVASLPVAEARALARKLVLAAWPQDPAREGYARASLLMPLARVDGAAAYDLARQDQGALDAVNLAVAKAHLLTEPGEALALVRQMRDVPRGAHELVAAARRHWQSHPDLARQCLAAARQMLPAVGGAESRVLLSAELGEVLRRLDPPAGTALLQECLQQAALLGVADRAAYCRGAVAQCSAVVDLPAALALLEPLTDASAHARHLTNLARRLAPVDPDRALELLGALKSNSWGRDQALATVVAFLPPEQFARAHKLAAGIETLQFRGYALARLCQAAPREQVPALLEEAQQALLEEAQRSGGTSEREPQALARLACLARRFGYPCYRDFAWRAASLRPRGAGSISPAYCNLRADFDLARMLAYTDPELSRHLTEGALQYAGGPAKLHADLYPNAVAAAAEVDLRWAVELLSQLPVDDARAERTPHLEATAALVRRLVETPAEREESMLASDYQWNWLAADDGW